MRKAGKLLAVALGACMCVGAAGALAGCGGDVGDGEIEFWYSASISDNKIMRELAEAYNKGQGVTDGVKVKTNNLKQIDKSSLFNNAPSVLMISDEDFKAFAIENLFLDLDGYYNDMPGEYSEAKIPATLTERFRFDTQDNAQGKRMAGKGAALQGIPFGNTPMIYYYSKPAFAAQNICVISCEEEKLAETYPNLQPHGYAEYTAENGAQAPCAGAVASQNLAGKQVYKVFNNRIPMNWEEFRYLSKCFTKNDAYNPNSTTEYGSGTHWWFSYGWSVGGDCIGYNGEKYEFTVADDAKNYLVTAADGITVGETHYAAGEIVRYEDKKLISDKTGLYELPSQRQALEEFVKLSTPASSQKGEQGGYGIGLFAEDNVAASLLKGKVAMLASDGSQITSLNVNYKQNYDFAPTTQYRKYAGGSVYYEGAETFANEYLKVIGTTYAGDSSPYTGELKKENGIAIIGRRAAFSSADALTIPKNSDPEKYEAAWKFIRWAASEEGQKIYAKTGMVPNQTSLAMSEDYLSAVDATKNYWAFADGSAHGEIGDWAYFENGQWVTDWSGVFNNQLRAGYMTIDGFLSSKKDAADRAVGAVKIVLNGRG